MILNDQPLIGTGAIVALNLTPEPIQTGGIHHRGGTATLLRAIMHFNLNPTINSANQKSASIGIYVSSHEAQLQLAFNDPNSDPLQDWYYWTARTMDQGRGSVDSVGIEWDADIRSSRRLRGGYDLTMVMAAFSTNVETVSLTASMRFLWQLP